MKLKLDENLGTRGAEVFRNVGHEVATVSEQGMTSATDPELLAACELEGRCLVTLDLDFSNPLIYPPEDFAGIAVLRLPARTNLADILSACSTLAEALLRQNIGGKLWIVQRARIREYQPPDDLNDAEPS